jgi:flagellar hook assembly protein FlgD
LISKNACIDSKSYFDGTGALLSVNSEKSATHTQLIVKDADGNIMVKQKIDLTSKTLEWLGKGTDGKTLKKGIYSVAVESFRGDKSLGTKPAEPYSKIIEVIFAKGISVLNLTGDQQVLLDKIKGLRDNS